jgi:hypothetical protein
MGAQGIENRGAAVEAGRISAAETPAAPQAGAPATPAGRYVVKGDPREDAAAFGRFADLLKAAYYESLHKGVVVVSFYEKEDETWPLTLILTQPFAANRERYAVLVNEDKAPIYVFDFEEMGWSDAALVLLQVAGWGLEDGKIVKIEVEVSSRW